MEQLFLSKNYAQLGTWPAVSQNRDKKQTIGWIHSRLCAPIEIKSWSDLHDLIFNHEFYRLVMTACWLLLAGLIEIFMAQLGDMRYDQQHPLIDLLHDAFPRIENFQIVNYFLTTCVAYTLIGFAIQSPNWSTRLTLLRRWTFLLGLLYVFRGITLLVTTLPSSLVDQCRPPQTELVGSLGQRFGFIYSVVSGSAFGCTDNIFSGHTSVIVSCMILWRVHSRLTRPFGWLLYLIGLTGIFLIIISRFHYTIDVLLALFITSMIWHVYLHYIREASLRLIFGFDECAALKVFEMSMTEGAETYQYLAWQPHLMSLDCLMYLCMYVDGLDIRFRSIGLLNEHGERRLEKHTMKSMI
ncbi:hypothetical protein G6F56_007736 [Rhizopus delemar]|uniref:Sphingomyelin synthase-like domain-containing protein n=1 Tax=Rhizopus stolonifer TaxID=4846 RepID=A0A367K455_RHIST|nr:hypothetical protein G6F56_007736 [Rhizopus delemar]RCH96926.1 hypothetical protein CU098_009380 [Rhizopus stolonifer]